MLVFNAVDKQFKNPIGAVQSAKTIKISVKANSAVNAVFLCMERDGGEKWKIFMKPTGKKVRRFTARFTLSKKGLYWYCFEAHTNNGVERFGRGDFQTVSSESLEPFQLSVYEGKPPCNSFVGGIMYHVFVDRFCKTDKMFPLPDGAVLKDWGQAPDFLPVDGKILNNDFFGGNLDGVTQKLDYLKTLNVSLIYLSPIFEANSNHKYNTGDMMTVDKGFGGESALKRLVEAAHKKGIKIIFDGVFNHTGDDSVYFNKYGNYQSVGAYQSKASPYFDWYTFFDFPDKYESWWGIDTLPQINEKSPSYQDFICGDNGVLEKWFSWGIDGLRLDVADELPDVFLDKLCAKVKSLKKESLIVGEVWEDASNKISYEQRRRYFGGGQLDSVMNYPLRNALINFVLNADAKALKETVLQQINNYPKFVLDSLMNILSTHDTERILTAVSGVEILGKANQAGYFLEKSDRKKAAEKARMCALLQYTLYGIPSLFYGDEAGLEGFRDPFCRACFPWGGEDKNMLAFFRLLGKLRTSDLYDKSPLTDIVAQDGLFSFRRQCGDQLLIVAANAGSEEAIFDFPDGTVDFFTSKRLGASTKLAPISFAVAVFLVDQTKK